MSICMIIWIDHIESIVRLSKTTFADCQANLSYVEFSANQNNELSDLGKFQNGVVWGMVRKYLRIIRRKRKLWNIFSLPLKLSIKITVNVWHARSAWHSGQQLNLGCILQHSYAIWVLLLSLSCHLHASLTTNGASCCAWHTSPFFLKHCTNAILIQHSIHFYYKVSPLNENLSGVKLFKRINYRLNSCLHSFLIRHWQID